MSKLTTVQKIVLGIGLLSLVMVVATISWLLQPISSGTTRGGGPGSGTAAGMAPRWSAAGEERVRAESVPSSFTGLPQERIATERIPNAAVSEPRSSQGAASPAVSSNPPAGFQISQSSEGLYIALDDRASVPAILGRSADGTSPQGTQPHNSEVVSRLADRILEDFVGEVTGSSAAGPASNPSPSLEQWENAAARANERYRTLLGDEEFMAATKRAAKQFRKAQ